MGKTNILTIWKGTANKMLQKLIFLIQKWMYLYFWQNCSLICYKKNIFNVWQIKSDTYKKEMEVLVNL